MKALLISACLYGGHCRYDGGCGADLSGRLAEHYRLIPVCPEVLGGLTTPREPAECREGRVYTRAGADVTENFRRGAAAALQLAGEEGCTVALLKERSPSCGCGEIYDGSFTGRKIEGDGVTAALLRSAGIRVLGESRVAELTGE